MTRYQIGFEDPLIKCDWVERNPGFVPIVDRKTFAAFGMVVALADNKDIAQRIVNLLNAAETE